MSSQTLEMRFATHKNSYTLELLFQVYDKLMQRLNEKKIQGMAYFNIIEELHNVTDNIKRTEELS